VLVLRPFGFLKPEGSFRARAAKPGELEGYPLNSTFSLLRAGPAGQCPTPRKEGMGYRGSPHLLRRPQRPTAKNGPE
jgi:hypothetical protein